ncbi:hypothetical protein CMQ_7426 [Grosmannia clavigera kw1407]|uniref:Uncharacterized protein n=1 Tax=Grosmannia clavigera (strain kw1407 / UAMH 11150) TaxID=655863 RepID=F0XPR4_GROCL|nr:uncharacterized protein CMQ_7426 [Grosmannia clavigera kw1407]EFX00424.1 hypothetical protein CMQ_7426 [Grosmannia clavigera kw1407]
MDKPSGSSATRSSLTLGKLAYCDMGITDGLNSGFRTCWTAAGSIRARRARASTDSILCTDDVVDSVRLAVLRPGCERVPVGLEEKRNTEDCGQTAFSGREKIGDHEWPVIALRGACGGKVRRLRTGVPLAEPRASAKNQEERHRSMEYEWHTPNAGQTAGIRKTVRVERWEKRSS